MEHGALGPVLRFETHGARQPVAGMRPGHHAGVQCLEHQQQGGERQPEPAQPEMVQSNSFRGRSPVMGLEASGPGRRA
jgi:hypothetical protein